MKRIAGIVLLLLAALCCKAQTFVRKADEPAKDFALRCKPAGMDIGDALQQQIIETTEWTKENAVIAFYTAMVPNYYDAADRSTYLTIIGYMYIPLSARKYQRVLIDTFETEGGDPETTAVFFANADKDSKRELVVLCKWPQQHYQVSGDLLDTRIYDNIDNKHLPARLTYLKAVSEKVSGGFDGDREGETVHSRFKNSRQVRQGLASMSYK